MVRAGYAPALDNRKYFSYNGIALNGQERGLIFYEEAFDPALFPWVRSLMQWGCKLRNRHRISEAQAHRKRRVVLLPLRMPFKEPNGNGLATEGKVPSRRGARFVAGASLHG